MLILSCDGGYALEKRPNKGLLAGLWQFPNVAGNLELAQVLHALEKNGLKPKEILRRVERKHIFTHIEWRMSGVYVEVREQNKRYTWLTAGQIRAQAALPTAFRQFFEELDNV